MEGIKGAAECLPYFLLRQSTRNISLKHGTLTIFFDQIVQSSNFDLL